MQTHTRTTTKLGDMGSFGKSLLKLQIIERLKLLKGEGLFIQQCRLGANDPTMHDQVIRDITDQMSDPGSYQGTADALGEELLFLIFKYNKK